MKMKVAYRENEHYLRASIEGRFDMGSFERAINEMNTLIDQHQCRTVFYDLRNIEMALETYEIYEIPKRLRAAGNISIKRAVVFPKDSAQDFSFFETVSANQGLNTRIFTTESEALDWLLA